MRNTTASGRDNRAALHEKSVQQRQASTLNSTDAMGMVEHGSEVTLNVTTPVGTKFITTRGASNRTEVGSTHAIHHQVGFCSPL